MLSKPYSRIVVTLFAGLGLLLASCEKEITVDLPKPDPKIVVEGYIFEGERPFVVLSKNAGYFDPVDSSTLAEIFITDAVVTVSDGLNTDTLTLQPAPECSYGFAYVKQNPTVLGQAGKNYLLTVSANGQTVTSTTRIVPPVAMDSTKWETIESNDSLGFVVAYYTDPGIDERGYRVFSRRASNNPNRNEPVFRPNFFFGNRFLKGENITLGIARARQFTDNFTDDNPDPDWGLYRIGDTAIVRICTMDLPNFNFYNSLNNSDNTGSPFAAPSNAQTNIQGGLGCWGGYGVTQITIVCGQ